MALPSFEYILKSHQGASFSTGKNVRLIKTSRPSWVNSRC